ncbi:MAG TPA: twin-arginine translocase TatA/TatE family subunit [Verrucomicrobiae bacterium]|nr:twin-arginine translocase TatA/TatE family subunit [Verrucomicrobiae bacterium]
MQAIADNCLMLALFNLGGGEIVLVLAAVLILFGAKKLPELARGLGEAISQFRKATRDVINAADDEASDAGRSLGGIYGRPAAQALTVDNQVAELYDPAAFQKESESRQTPKSLLRFVESLWYRAMRFLTRLRIRTS